MPALQSSETKHVKASAQPTKESTQLKIFYFMERSVSDPTPAPERPMTSKQAKSAANKRYRSRRRMSDSQMLNGIRQDGQKRKKAEGLKAAERRREKAKLAPKKAAKLIEGQGFLPGFGFAVTKPRAQTTNDGV